VIRAEATEPSIRGSYLTPSKAWIRKTYGDGLWSAALKRLPPEQQAAFGGELVSLAWYPLKHWAVLLEAVREGVKAQTGESAATFDHRHVFESVGGAMETVYRIAFSVLSATTVVAKVTPYFKKVYSHGEYQVIENRPGFCIIRFADAPVEMLPELERSFPIATEWMLNAAGQRVTEHNLTSKVTGKLFSCDLQLTYVPKK